MSEENLKTLYVASAPAQPQFRIIILINTVARWRSVRFRAYRFGNLLTTGELT